MESLFAHWRNCEGARVGTARDPAEREASCSQCGTNRAGKVQASFTPIEARTTEGAATVADMIYVYAEFSQELLAGVCDDPAVLGQHDMIAIGE